MSEIKFDDTVDITDVVVPGNFCKGKGSAGRTG